MTIEVEDVIEKLQSEDDDVDEGAPVYRIRSYPSDPELETLHNRWKRGEIEIPKFQRRFVWKPTQASKLIESFLVGLPVPGIFVFTKERDEESGTQKQLVIDGQQRLMSVFGYFDGELPDGRPFRLTGVDVRWETKRFRDLSSSDQSKLLYSVLRVINIEQTDPQDGGSSIYQIFERLNTGGTALTPQEIRNNTYHGSFNDMLVEVNNSPNWRRIFGAGHPDVRMRDVELIVRFLALYEGSDSYEKPMKTFLNNYMGSHKNEPNSGKFRDIFLQTVEKIAKCIPKERPFHVRRGINVAVYDSVMVAFAKNEKIPANIVDRYADLLNDEQFNKATTAGTTDVDTVRERLALAREILFG